MTDDEAAERFFGGFYRDPDPAIAVGALRKVVTEGRLERVFPMFALGARRDDRIAAAFREARGDDAFRRGVESVLADAGNPKLPDPASVAPENPAVLDFLWGAFLLTGDPAPVRRIATALDREDRVRRELGAWLGAPPWLPWRRARWAARVELLREHRYPLDGLAIAVGSPLDLDLHTWARMAGGMQVREVLPFPIDQAFVAHLALKGTACWSLQSNARQHAVVAEVYDSLDRRERLPSLI